MKPWKLAGLLVAGALSLAAAKHERAYKTAKVLDSSTSQETHVGEAHTTTQQDPLDTTGISSSNTRFDSVTVRTNRLLIRGVDYDYVVADTREQYSNPGWALIGAVAQRHHGCRFVVGETVSYAQEKGTLYIIDVDGKDCKLPILRQTKR